MESKYIAHIAEDGRKQSVSEHCRNTAEYASDSLKNIGAEKAAYLAGLLHDLGKFQQEFQEYLFSQNGIRGSVIHTFQGCRMMLEHFHQDGATEYKDITSELIAYAIGAHHGLFDCVDLNRMSGFQHRIKSEKAIYNEAKENFLKECADIGEIEKLFNESDNELRCVYEKIDNLAEDYSELNFYLGALARLVLSAVIEGDRRDTAEFMNKTSFSGWITDGDFWKKYLCRVENKLDKFPKDTPIGKARHEISQQCRGFASNEVGIYRLNVPTGAGKTLSSLRFALAHAAKWEKSKIIFTAPLLTILDQNAAVIREFIDDDNIILEHHSNVIHTNEDSEWLDRNELLEENWSIPIIITSMVQLLNTFFDGKTSSIRRFQALCNSVIIIDEVQSIPNNMLSIFNLMLNFLTEVCNVTFVLCSATQPALDKAQHPLNGALEEMVPYKEEIWSIFKRTEIIDSGNFRLDEISKFIFQKLERVDNMLIICNKKAEAEYIFKQMSEESIYCLHLSAAMCQAHRREVLHKAEEAIKRSHATKCKFVLISTQVIEAGVDISFDRVIRFMAGMDSVVQAAGRCNRNAEKITPSQVYLVNCTDENLSFLRGIQEGKVATTELLCSFQSNPQKYENDLASGKAIAFYYECLYKNMPEGYQDFVTKDGNKILSLLSINEQYANEDSDPADKYFLRQAFKTAGKLFVVFDSNTEDVVVPYGEGRELIEELVAMNEYGLSSEMESWLKRAKPYTVSVYNYQKELLESGGIYEKNGILVLTDGFYDPDTGFSVKNSVNGFMEV